MDNRRTKQVNKMKFAHLSFFIAFDDTTITAAKNYQGDNRKFLKGWMRGIKLYRKNGCHYPTQQPLKRE